MTLPNIEPFDGLQDAEFALLTFMQHWSEELRASQWYGQLEYFLTSVGPHTIDNPDIPPANFQDAYRALIEQAGGWFTYGPEGRQFVPGTYDQLVAAASQRSGASGSQR